MPPRDPTQILDAARRASLGYAAKTSGTKVRQLLTASQNELKQRLQGIPASDKSFTTVQMRAVLKQIQAVLPRLKAGITGTLTEGGAVVGEASATATLRYLDQAERSYKGVAGYGLGINTAQVLDRAVSGANASVVRRIAEDPMHPGQPGVVSRYGSEVQNHFEKTLQVGIVTGASWDTMKAQLVQGSPFLQSAPEYWAERLLRTELMGAHSTAANLSLVEVDQQAGGRMLRILSAMFDDRTGCLLGSTRVTGGVIRAVFRRWYEGPMLRIITESGRQLSATPNHPVMTAHGWVGANDLQLGDDLICDGRQQNPGPSRDEYIAGCPTTIGQIFDAVAALGICQRRRTTKPDFHGDGMYGEVDILYPDDLLLLGRFSPLYQPSAQLVFPPTDDMQFCPSCGALIRDEFGGQSDRFLTGTQAYASFAQTSRDQGLRGPDVAFYAIDRLATQITLGDIGDRHRTISGMPVLDESEGGCFGRRSGNSKFGQFFRDVSTMDIQSCGHLRQRQSGSVQRDRVIDIQSSTISGHVYNLSTVDGYYAADGVYTSNSDSYAMHGQIRRTDEPFDYWEGRQFMTPPNRPNDREIVVPHHIEWPIPDNLKPKSDAEVLERWLHEKRKGSPPARPRMTTVPIETIGRTQPGPVQPPSGSQGLGGGIGSPRPGLGGTQPESLALPSGFTPDDMLMLMQREGGLDFSLLGIRQSPDGFGQLLESLHPDINPGRWAVTQAASRVRPRPIAVKDLVIPKHEHPSVRDLQALLKPNKELKQDSTAIRMPDGRVVVANGVDQVVADAIKAVANRGRNRGRSGPTVNLRVIDAVDFLKQQNLEPRILGQGHGSIAFRKNVADLANTQKAVPALRRVVEAYGYTVRRINSISANAETDDRLRGLQAAGINDWDGTIAIRQDMWRQHQSAMQTVQAGGDPPSRDLVATHVVIHEVVHGCSPGKMKSYQQGARVLEEVFTEIQARAIMDETFGTRTLTTATGSYQPYIDQLCRVVEERLKIEIPAGDRYQELRKRVVPELLKIARTMWTGKETFDTHIPYIRRFNELTNVGDNLDAASATNRALMKF